MLKFWAFRLFMPVIGRFPGASYPVANAVGWILFHLNRRARASVLSNLRPACGSEAEVQREARRTFQNATRYYVDLASTPHLHLEEFERKHLTVLNEERLPALFDAGPTIVLSAHAGNPELALVAIAARGRTFVELVEPLEPRRLARYVTSLREAGGGSVQETGRAGLRAAIRELRGEGLVAIMGDRDIQGTGVCVTMLERRVRLPRGPWELAQRTGARVVPMLLSRERGANQTVLIEEPICLDPGRKDAIEEAAQRWASLLEAHIRREPGQWTVLEDFWGVHGCGEG
jgi:phosphatidylinositol dimannoside acyltransferase